MNPSGAGLEDNREWLDGFRSGAGWALAEVYRTYQEVTVRTLRRALRRQGMPSSDFELEQALSEVFRRAFEPKARARYDGVRPFEGFIVGIARNYLREIGRLREDAAGTADEVALLSPERDRGPEDRSLDSELAALLDGYLATLAPEARTLYEYRFVEERSQEEVAAALGLTRIQLRRRELSLKRDLLRTLHRGGYLTQVRRRGWTFWMRRTAQPE